MTAQARMDAVQERVPCIEDIRTEVFIELGFKGKEGDGQIGIFCNRLSAALMPGPNGRQDVIDDRNAGGFRSLNEAHIKAG